MRTRHLVAVAVSVALLGCSPGADPSRDTSADREGPGGSSRSPTTAATDGRPDPRLEDLRAVPDVRRPRELARRVVLLDGVLRDPRAEPADVRRAAELHQIAARTLGLAPPARAAAVLRLLRPPLRTSLAREVSAARGLSTLASPQPTWPDWRVVAPPPAARLLRAYREAQRRSGVGWEYLAAIHLVETRMGRIRGVSTAGAQGPMQFLPSTWAVYGGGGDIRDLEDAVMAAARLLRANGAPADIDRALWHYNHSDAYVSAVGDYAANLRSTPLALRSYRHWRVLYRHVSGTKVLPVGYPRRPAVPISRS